MLKLYHHPLSPISRRVWWALLEKAIAFEPVVVDLTGAQFQPEYLAMNPFHHVPVLVDGDFTLIESLAILDYLEQKYPIPSLLPAALESIAQVKMVQMVTTNELLPKAIAVARALEDPAQLAKVMESVNVALGFLHQQLGDDPHFGGAHLSLADIVVGTALPLFVHLEVSLEPYPALQNWYDRISQREFWQKTNPSDQEFLIWKRFVTKMQKK